MTKLVFITDIQNFDEVNSLKDTLNVALGFREWHFNLIGTNMIFTVEVLSTTSSEIINLFDSLGYSCKEV